MTSREITRILALRHWSPRKQIIVPRCHFTGYEADLLVMSPAGYLEEVEVKISLADFKRDLDPACLSKFEKHRRLREPDPYYNDNRKVKRFWFAVPNDLVGKIENLIPEHAGLLSVVSRRLVRVVKEAPVITGHRKLTDDLQKKLMRLAYLRYWTVEEKEGD